MVMSEPAPEAKKFELSPSISIIIAGVIIAGAIMLSNNRAEAGPTAVEAKPTPRASNIRPPNESDHIRGSITAPIVLVEYSDYQCPYCSVIYPTLKKIVDESDGQIAWAYRHFPLTSIHPQASPTANASECVAEQLGNDGFWRFTDAIYTNQTKLSPIYYVQLATQLGVDPTRFAACVKESKYQNVIDLDATEAQSNGGAGTPFTVVLNTKTQKAVPVSGALSYAQIMNVINAVK